MRSEIAWGSLRRVRVTSARTKGVGPGCCLLVEFTGVSRARRYGMCALSNAWAATATSTMPNSAATATSTMPN
eukprot:5194483-Pyramimonas_sp.AAC.1